MGSTYLTINKGSFLSQCIFLTEDKEYKVRKLSGENVCFYDDAGNIRVVDKKQVSGEYNLPLDKSLSTS